MKTFIPFFTSSKYSIFIQIKSNKKEEKLGYFPPTLLSLAKTPHVPDQVKGKFIRKSNFLIKCVNVPRASWNSKATCASTPREK